MFSGSPDSFVVVDCRDGHEMYVAVNKYATYSPDELVHLIHLVENDEDC